MKTRKQWMILGALYLLFVACLVLTASQLPPLVATHFKTDGRADGWMSRAAHLRFMAVFGLLFPFVVLGVTSLARLFPAALNLPRKQFWLAPERREQTFDYLRQQSLWFACFAILFILGLQLMIVGANTRTPAQLSMPLHFTLAGGFLAAIIAWLVITIRRFYRTEKV